jgi:signal transduction histidine kinase
MAERVERLVESLLPALAEPMRERGIELRLELPRDLPSVRVDPMQLEQALLELVSNALDAMPEGGQLRVAADSRNGGSAGGEVVIEIADTGPGIPAHVLPSVCEPFFTTRQEGTGLGLAIAKRYVEQNGGRLEIESSPGSGTRVRVRLPAEANA